MKYKDRQVHEWRLVGIGLLFLIFAAVMGSIVGKRIGYAEGYKNGQINFYPSKEMRVAPTYENVDNLKNCPLCDTILKH